MAKKKGEKNVKKATKKKKERQQSTHIANSIVF
jgi:hypothetical protein